MYYIDESNNKQHEYPTYGRQFCTYKWFKPILVSLLTGIIFLAFVISLMLVTTKSLPHGFDISYENLDFNNIGLSIYVLGSMAVAIPALWIASKIVRDRPFSSYSSARGGWNFKIFFICMLLALVFVAAPVTVRIYLATGFKSDVRLSLAGFLVILLLGPLQCIAEEYLFRGLFMQTLGSWVKIPIVAVIAQALVFGLSHTYNIAGFLSIVISGLCFGLATQVTRGIEASCAQHIANNLPLFFFVGMNMVGVSGTPGFEAVLNTLLSDGLYLLALFILKKKTKLFDEVTKDDLAAWNEKHTN